MLIREPGDLPSDDNRTAGRGAPAATSRPAPCGRIGGTLSCRAGWRGRGVLLSERVPHLHICITCRAGQAIEDGAFPPGQHLYDAVAGLADPELVLVKPISCLASCERGCAAVISQPGRWGYLLGHLRAELAGDLLAYAGAYAASKTGTVMPSKRPPSLLSVVLGRVPPVEVL